MMTVNKMPAVGSIIRCKYNGKPRLAVVESTGKAQTYYKSKGYDGGGHLFMRTIAVFKPRFSITNKYLRQAGTDKEVFRTFRLNKCIDLEVVKILSAKEMELLTNS